MKIEDLMSKDLVIANVYDSIKDISILMKQYDIGFIPLSNNQSIEGVITDRDLVVNALYNGAKENDSIIKYMNKNIIAIDKSKTIEDALKTMAKEQVKRLLIKEPEENKIIGILSLSDIINNTDINVSDTLKSIWNINKNTDEYQAEIDEFYL